MWTDRLRQIADDFALHGAKTRAGVLRDLLLVLTAVNVLIFLLYSRFGIERLLMEMAISSLIAGIVTVPIAFQRHLQHARIRALAEELKVLAHTDSLSGLGNRRAMFERFAVLPEPERAAYATFDIDHFKSINDTFGHAGGDAVITAFGHLLASELPAGASAARMGGEEFGVLFPDAAPDAAAQFAVRVRSKARQMIVGAPNGLPITFTVSAGCSSGHADADRLMREADGALYRAKFEGRDKVVAA